MKKTKLTLEINKYYNYLSYLEFLTARYNNNPQSIKDSPLDDIVLKFREISFGSKIGQVGNKFFIWSVFQKAFSQCQTPEDLNALYKNRMVGYAQGVVDLVSDTCEDRFSPLWEKKLPVLQQNKAVIEKNITDSVLSKISENMCINWHDEITINLVMATANGTSFGYPLTIVVEESVPDEYLVETIVHELLHYADLTDVSSQTFFNVLTRKMNIQKVNPMFVWLIKHAWIYYYSGEVVKNSFKFDSFVPIYDRRTNKCSSVENVFINAIKNDMSKCGYNLWKSSIDQLASMVCSIGERSRIEVS